MQISSISNKQTLLSQLDIIQMTGLSKNELREKKQGISLWIKLIQIIINNNDDVGSFKVLLPRRVTLGYDFMVWPPQKSLILYACEYNRKQIVDYLIKELLFDINVVNPDDGYTPVHYACYYGQPQFLIFLLEENAQYQLMNYSEELPLLTVEKQLGMLKKQLKKVSYEKGIEIKEDNLIQCKEILMKKEKENDINI